MKKIFSFFAALMLSVGVWAANSVITFTSTSKLYPGNIVELILDKSKWEAFKAQYPELADVMDPTVVGFFNPNCFLDANDQVLDYTYNYDDATHTGTITFAGELVTMYGKYIDNVCAFVNCSSLTSITLPEGLTSIGEYSFSFCNNLTTVNLPASLTTIAVVAFTDCTSLTSITIPANVTEIGYGAFTSCSGLTDFYVAWTTTLPTIGEDLFKDASIGTATLHVPAGSLALYQNADQWKDFGSIVEYVPQEVKDAAIAAVNAEIAETDNDNVKAIATSAVTAINAATTIAEINALKTLAIAAITSAKAAYTAGESATLGEMGTPCVGCTAIKVTKGDKTVTLYAPESVDYIKIEE